MPSENGKNKGNVDNRESKENGKEDKKFEDDETNKTKLRQIETYGGSFLMSPKNDFCFKGIFGDENNKDILISFLSAVMRIKQERFADLELINTELSREFAEDRRGVLDVRVKLKDGEEIDIEIQLSYTKYMAERTLFYWSKMYTGNIQTGDSYSKLKKCVTINILDFKTLPLEKLYSKFHITEDETGYKLTDVLEIYYLELLKLNDEKLKHTIDEDDPIIQWMMFLEARNEEALDMLAKKSPEIKKAKSILEVMSQSKKARMLYEAREAQLHDIATGLEEAREEGKEEGKEENLLENILTLLTIKFGTIPPDMKKKISKLDTNILNLMLIEIFIYESLDDIKKHLS